MFIITRVKTTAVKTLKFIDRNATEIGASLIGISVLGSLWLVNEVIKDNVAIQKRLTNVELLAIDTATHPRHTVENEDGSFSVTRLSKRNVTEDTPV